MRKLDCDGFVYVILLYEITRRCRQGLIRLKKKTQEQDTVKDIGKAVTFLHKKYKKKKPDKWNPIHPNFKENLGIKIMKVVIYLKEIHDKLLTEVFIKSKADTGHQDLSA